jgi:hypothetical protein
MTKSEQNAYDWLVKQKHQNITFYHQKTPDFITDKGYYEIKMPTKTNAIYFGASQIDWLLTYPTSMVLLFNTNSLEPISIIPSIDLKDKPNIWGKYKIYYDEKDTIEFLEYINKYIREQEYHLSKWDRYSLFELYHSLRYENDIEYAKQTDALLTDEKCLQVVSNKPQILDKLNYHRQFI